MRYTFGDYVLDTQRQELHQAGAPIPLRRKVLQVLAYLLAHRERVVAKQELLEQLWPDQFVGDEALTSCVRMLRHVLGERGRRPRFVRTVHGQGYRFVAPVEAQVPLAADVSAPPACSALSVMRRAVPPVGREVELTRLHAWHAQALSGVRQIVFVTGEAGLGKTTLVEAFVVQLGTNGPLWIGHGQCVEHYGAGEPYLPVLEALGRLCRGPGGPEVVALLGQQAPTWLLQMPGLVPADALETLRRRMVGVTRERMLLELAEALELLTAQQPLVLVLEDLHWSDPSTLDLLAVLARRREPARLLCLGTYRSPEVRGWAHPLSTLTQELQLHGHSVELPLTLLSEAAIAAYLTSRLPGLPQVDQLARLVYQRTEGNPLFMVMLVESWLAHGVLVEQDGVWALSAGVEALHDRVPDSLRQMIDRQLDRLRAEEQRVLEAASVAGMAFSAATVAAGLGQEVERVDDACTALARRGQFLLTRGDQTWPDGTVAGSYCFVHALYQQVLYQRVSAAQRVRLHQRLGARLEAGHGAQAGVIAAELAMHFVRGRDNLRAVQYLHLAGQQAVQRAAYTEAISYVTTALELLITLPDTVERAQRELALQLTLARVVEITKGAAAPETGRLYTRARELGQQVGEIPQLFVALTGLHESYGMRGEYQTAHELAAQLLSLAQRQRDPALLAAGHQRVGQSLFWLGALAAARSHLEQAIALADSQWHPTTADMGRGRIGARNYVAVVLWLLGYPEQALERSQEALTLAMELSDPNHLAFALCYAAVLHQCRREAPLTQARAEACITLATERGLVARAAVGTILRGWALAVQGHGEVGLAHLRQGLTSRQATGPEVGWARYLPYLAEAYGQVGQTAAGLSVLAEALACAHTTGERYKEAELYRLQGELLLTRHPSSPAAPEACFRQALEIARSQQAKSWELRAAMSLSRLWQRQGQRTEARELLAPAYGWFTEGFDTADLQEAKALLDALGEQRHDI